MRLLLLPVLAAASMSLSGCFFTDPQVHGPFLIGANDGNHVGHCRAAEVRSVEVRTDWTERCKATPPAGIGADDWKTVTVTSNVPVVTSTLPPAKPGRSAWD